MAEIETQLAMPLRVLKLEQNTPQWLEARKKYRTASESPIVLGLSPWTTPKQLASQKFYNGRNDSTAATQHGHKHEGRARREFQAAYRVKMTPTCVVRGDYMASLDGWHRQSAQILEIKCPYRRRDSDTWLLAEKREIPDYYWYQVQHQLWVAQAKLCYFWVYDSDSQKGLCLKFRLHPEAMEEMHAAWETFMTRYAPITDDICP